MIYKLHFVNPQGGRNGYFLYDVATNALMNPSRSPVFIGKKKPVALSVSHHVHPLRPGIKSRKVDFLRIQLGLKCNYSCSYCSQAAHAGDESLTTIEDVLAFLNSLDSWIEGAPKKIDIWGGEPFVYWKKLKILVEGLRVKFPETKFVIVTNGSLLDKKKIKFIVDNDIAMAISHDGPGQAARGKDPMNNPELLQVWKKLHELRGGKNGKLSFNSVLTPENCNVPAIIDFFKEKIGEDVVVGIEGVVTGNTNDSSATFTEGQYATLVRSIFESVADARYKDNGALVSHAEGFLMNLAHGSNLLSLPSRCGMDLESYLAVDLAGNVLTCQNVPASSHKIGHTSEIENVRLNTATHFSFRAQCATCPVVQICRGGCMYSNGREFDRTCQNSFHFGMAILASAIYLATGVAITRIEGSLPEFKTDGKFRVINLHEDKSAMTSKDE